MTALTPGPDGLPSDPRLRWLAGRTIGLAYHIQKGARPGRDQFLDIVCSRWMREKNPDLVAAVPDVVDLLVRGGFIRVEGGYGYGRSPGTGTDAEARMLAFADNLAARCVGDDPGAPALARLFLEIRAAHAVFSTVGGDLSVLGGDGSPALLVPAGYAVDPRRGVVLTGARVIVFGHSGTPEGLWAPSGAVTLAHRGHCAAVATVDLGACGPWRDPAFRVSEMCLSPVRGRSLHRGLRDEFEPDWKPLRSGRAAASTHTGAAIDAGAWRRFAMACSKSRKMTGHVVRLAWKSADPAARRCCQRVPYATMGLYGWFAASDPVTATRRRQASESYPSLTLRLPQVQAEIDAGLPLEPALVRATGLPRHVVRHMRAMSWQSFGRGWGGHGNTFETMVTRGPAPVVREILGDVVPERLPRTKAGWAAMLETCRILSDTLAWPASRPLVAKASADWARLPAMAVATGLADALRTTAWDISLACEHGLRDLTSGAVNRADDAARMALVSTLLGDDGGLARLERFAKEWHRGASRRTVERMRIERGVWGDAPTGWVALTRKGFDCADGGLEWITVAEDLVAEGDAMRHCVGTRQFSCLYAEHHVARVTGAAGGRSTVEFTWSCTPGPSGRMGMRLALVEHKAALNDDPPPDCVATVAAFMARGARLVDRAAVSRGLAARAAHLASRRTPMPPWAREALLGSYGPCLDRHGAGTDPDTWLARVLACIEPRHERHHDFGEAVPVQRSGAVDEEAPF